MAGNQKTVEGIRTCKVIHDDILKNYPEFEAPITNCVYEVLYENGKPSEKVKELMNRTLKSESIKG